MPSGCIERQEAAPRVAVYTHKDPEPFLRRLAGERIHRSEALEIYSIRAAAHRRAGGAARPAHGVRAVSVGARAELIIGPCRHVRDTLARSGRSRDEHSRSGCARELGQRAERRTDMRPEPT